MMRTRDPRIRQRINQISYNLESANETAQEGLYAFSHNYLSPCLASVGRCVSTCAAPCLPTREEQLRRRRRGRAEANFDFYDDWDNEAANDRLLGWGTDELDRLLAGSGLAGRGTAEQPRRPRNMSYGTRGARRKSSVLVPDTRDDPTVIPSSSLLGFLERFPWRFGARGVKYRPSAADLQEHPKALQQHGPEDEPLMESTDEAEEHESYGKNVRVRSGTQSSRETANSFSSRGDLFPSDEEEDAVPLDDEFALALGSRRDTGLDTDDHGLMKRSMSGTQSLGTSTSKGSKRKKKSRRLKSPPTPDFEVTRDVEAPTVADLKKEEERAALEEEMEVARKRDAAHRLALSRGLGKENDKSTSPLSTRPPTVSDRVYSESASQISMEERDAMDGHSRESHTPQDYQYSSDQSQTEPFPAFPLTPPATDHTHESVPPSQPDNLESGDDTNQSGTT